MGIMIDDVRHCLKVMVDCEVCEECKLYGTTGTDHCEHDCVCEALDIINKYQMMQADYETHLKADMVAMLEDLRLDFQEVEVVGVVDDKELVYADEVDDFIQQKIINILKGEKEDEEKRS